MFFDPLSSTFNVYLSSDYLIKLLSMYNEFILVLENKINERLFCCERERCSIEKNMRFFNIKRQIVINHLLSIFNKD